MTDHRKTAVYIRLSAEDDNVDGLIIISAIH